MHRRQFSSLTSVAVAFLLFAGCDDSKNPLSDPQKSKPDTRLTGVWRLRGDGGEVTYYHIGTMGDKVMFTDTTENLARFIAEAGDSLFAKEPLRLERVK